MSPDPVIIFEDVRKTFRIRHARSLKQTVLGKLRGKSLTEKFNAVDHLDFSVYAGESVAVLGRNGSGKSTTLKLLSGVLRPDEGEILTLGRVAGLLEVGAGFHPDLTGRENVYLNAAILGMSREETDERFDDIVEFSELGDFIDTEVKRYSSGMYARLGFSVAVHTEHDVLLVDEVLSVGDAEFRAKCNAKMAELQKQGKTMFIVSHSAEQVKKLCQRGIVLDHGRKVFDGPIDEAVKFMKPAKAQKTVPAKKTAPAPAKASTKPIVTKHPDPVTVMSGETAVFFSEAEGATSVRWQLHPPGARWAWAGYGGETQLKVADVKITESGTLYRAWFNSPAGAVFSRAVELTVMAPASSETPPEVGSGRPAAQRKPTELQQRLAEQNRLRERSVEGNSAEKPLLRNPRRAPELDVKPRHGA